MERLVWKIFRKIEYPKSKLEFKVFDDSNRDDSVLDTAKRNQALQENAVFDIKHIRRTNRQGNKARKL